MAQDTQKPSIYYSQTTLSEQIRHLTKNCSHNPAHFVCGLLKLVPNSVFQRLKNATIKLNITPDKHHGIQVDFDVATATQKIIQAKINVQDTNFPVASKPTAKVLARYWHDVFMQAYIENITFNLKLPLTLSAIDLIELFGVKIPEVSSSSNYIYPTRLIISFGKKQQQIDIRGVLQIDDLAAVDFELNAWIEGKWWVSPLIVDLNILALPIINFSTRVYPQTLKLKLRNFGLIEDIIVKAIKIGYSPYIKFAQANLSQEFYKVARQYRHAFNKKLFYGLSDFISTPHTFELTLTRQGSAHGITQVWHNLVMWINANYQWQKSENLLRRTASSRLQRKAYQTRAKKTKYQDKLLSSVNQGFMISILVNGKPIK